MLVLTRREQETIHIGDAVITIIQLGRGQVKIGIEAPEKVKILRGELAETPSKKG